MQSNWLLVSLILITTLKNLCFYCLGFLATLVSAHLATRTSWALRWWCAQSQMYTIVSKKLVFCSFSLIKTNYYFQSTKFSWMFSVQSLQPQILRRWSLLPARKQDSLRVRLRRAHGFRQHVAQSGHTGSGAPTDEGGAHQWAVRRQQWLWQQSGLTIRPLSK